MKQRAELLNFSQQVGYKTRTSFESSQEWFWKIWWAGIWYYALVDNSNFISAFYTLIFFLANFTGPKKFIFKLCGVNKEDLEDTGDKRIGKYIF